jgi:hypothetical protein
MTENLKEMADPDFSGGKRRAATIKAEDPGKL